MLKEIEPILSLSRPPRTTSRPPKFDIAALAQVRAVGKSARGISFVVDFPWDVVEALTDAQGEHVPLEPSDAVNFIMLEWLTTNGYLALAPASEDGTEGR